MSNFCIYCGASLGANDRFCPKCGKQVKAEDVVQKEVVVENSPIINEVEKTPNDTDVVSTSAQEDVSESGVPAAPAKKNKPKILFFAGATLICVIALLAGILGGNGDTLPAVDSSDNNDSSVTEPSQLPEEKKSELPDLQSFDFLMEKAVIEFYRDVEIDAREKGYLLNKYEVMDMTGTEAVYDDSVSCTYGPGSNIGLMATAVNDKVDYVFTFIPLIGVETTSEDILNIGPMLMIPATLFNDDYTTYEDLADLMRNIIQNGTRDEEGDSGTLVIEGIEYTFTASNSMVGFTVNAREKNGSNIGTDGNTIDDNGPGAIPEVQTGASWFASYSSLLDGFMRDYPNYQYSCDYTLYDIDENGIPEMFVKVGTCEADFECRVFTADNNGGTTLIDTLPGGHASICGISEKGAFLLWGGHQGYETISKVTYKNGKFTSEVIFDAEVVNYHELTSLMTYELDNRSGLNWNGNSAENNQSVLDNYSMEDNVISEPAITDTNFESVVPLVKRDNWYDNGIFSSYFKSCDHPSDVKWSYIGTSPDIFGLAYSGYDQVDAYRVDYSDGWKTYLLVPYNENVGNPPVVYLFFDSNEAPWEIWRGDQ